MADNIDRALTALPTRPLGLRLGAVLLLLFGIFGLLGASTGIFIWHGSALLITFYSITGVLALLEFVCVWGLWALKSWAFWLTVSAEVAWVVCMVIALLISIVWHSSSSLLTSLVFPIAILLCLFVDPGVRTVLRARPGTVKTS
ncbi:MAG: hypothetical protein NVS2B12_36620 [Ktedonobacteraceae bacterium]